VKPRNRFNQVNRTAKLWLANSTKLVPVTDPEILGHQMRAFREKSGISLREVARGIELSAMFLSDCERGKRKLNEEYLEKYIAVILNHKTNDKSPSDTTCAV
jgi:DNA transposition AAA+ family ATPase